MQAFMAIIDLVEFNQSMKKNLLLLFALLLTISVAKAQIVSIQPSNANGDQEIKLIFDATQGDAGLVGASKVYIHSGVVTDSPTGIVWTFVKGNWGADDGIGLMTKVSGESDKWEITLSATAREYYGVPSGTNMFRLSMVFRNADGSSKGAGTPGTISGGEVASNGDIYMNLMLLKCFLDRRQNGGGLNKLTINFLRARCLRRNHIPQSCLYHQIVLAVIQILNRFILSNNLSFALL